MILPDWPTGNQLVRLQFELVAPIERDLPLNYAAQAHAWFLDQMRRLDPELSAYLHDGGSEKAFTLSDIEGRLPVRGRQVTILPGRFYRWSVSALSSRVADALVRWLTQLPPEMYLEGSNLSFRIQNVILSEPATTYTQLLARRYPNTSLAFTFVTATAFRRKGHHLPLPWPTNIWGSWLRRWNDFSGLPIDQEAFLNWVDESVVILRHHIETVKVVGGKSGAVTGFTGPVEFGLDRAARANQQFCQYFYALAALAPYCGTGHKTAFGLGTTRIGWQDTRTETSTVTSPQTQLAERIADLASVYLSQRKRTGGERAIQVAETWATILARREFGESLQTIATDLQLPYETVKTYAKLARRALAAPPPAVLTELPDPQDHQSTQRQYSAATRENLETTPDTTENAMNLSL
jgi:CRISPR-associated endoribonuclease Cas6